MKDVENGVEDYFVEGLKGELDKVKVELEEFKAVWLNFVNDKFEFDLLKLNEGKLFELNKENIVLLRFEKLVFEFLILVKVGIFGNLLCENFDIIVVNEFVFVLKILLVFGIDVLVILIVDILLIFVVVLIVVGINKDNIY